MNTRVNVVIPKGLMQKSHELIRKGYFSNFSELMREGLRKQIIEYETRALSFNEDERRLFTLLKETERKKLLLTEKEMKKHGVFA